MRKLLFAAAFALAGAAAAAQAAPVPGRPAVEDESVVDAGGRILSESIIIEAPREQVWRAFATTEGLLKWQAPVAEIDLKVGGHLEASYNPKARIGDPGNIRHEILAYRPGRLIVFRNVQVPPGFKHGAEFGKVVTVLEFEDAGPGRTKVTCSGVGYQSGQAWDELYKFFHAGNAYVLEALKAHVEGKAGPSGPAH
jgi:uncharacterized protein YndB with AHSA1/START domain